MRSMSPKFKVISAITFLVVAAGILAMQLVSYLDSPMRQKKFVPRETAVQFEEPVTIKEGEIQHIITKLKPVVPSGKVLETDGSSSIQAVINSANYGDTVIVKGGIYTESLVLKDGIILKGKEGENAVVQGDMRYAVLRIEGCRSVEVSNLTFKHFNQLSQDADYRGQRPVVQIDNSGAKLANITICDSSADGVRIQNDSVHMDHVEITNCTITNNRSDGVIVLGNGNVELIRNTCTGNGRNGICFRGYTDGVLTGNICRNNVYNGICVQDSAGVETYENTCGQNQCSGIWCDSGSPFTAKKNDCSENCISGINIKSQIKVLVDANNCKGNKINGIHLTGAITGSVSENVCTENKWHGISIERNCVPNAADNKCFKNTRCGIYDDGGMLGLNAIYDNGEFCLQEIQMYLRAQKFDELEKMAAQMREEKRRFENGNWQLAYFYGAFEIGYGSRPFEENIELCEKWVSQYPSSITPRIALATAIYKQGWHIRGGGYANTVSQTSWQPFKESLAKAREVLVEAEKLNAKDPSLYSTWISVATGLGNLEEIETAFEKGAAIEPTYYPLHFNRGFAYLPKWFGKNYSYELIAAQAADLTKDQIGQTMYFLFGCEMTVQAHSMDEYKKSGFDYERIKQGQKDIAKQFPEFLKTKTANQLCFMACAAENKEDARDYFLDIGDDWDKTVWQDIETFEKYKAWARNREANVEEPASTGTDNQI